MRENGKGLRGENVSISSLGVRERTDVSRGWQPTLSSGCEAL